MITLTSEQVVEEQGLASEEVPAPTRRSWVRSLRFDLTASFTGAFALVLGIAWILGYAGARQDLIQDSDAILSVDATRFVDEQVRPHFGSSPFGEYRRTSIVSLVFLRATDAQTGRTIINSGEMARREDVPPILDTALREYQGRYPHLNDQATRYNFVVPSDTQRMRVLTRLLVVNHHPIYIQAAMPWYRSSMLLRRVAAISALGLIAALAAASAISWQLVGRSLAPIGRIVAELSRLDPADLPLSLLPPPESDSEIGSLVRTLNSLVKRLRTSFQSQARYVEAQKRFAADASHELRTPITILRGEIELSLSRPRNIDSYRQTLQSALEEIDHMAQIVEGLGMLARQDAGAIAADTGEQQVDLYEITRDLIYDNCAVAEERGITLSQDYLPGPHTVRGNSAQCERLIGNLVDNALKYTPTGGSVVVRLTRTKTGGVRISVIDTGIGIADADLPHIFERFWRADPARTTMGTGLGLSICEAIARAHGARLSVASVEGKGSTFTVEFPQQLS